MFTDEHAGFEGGGEEGYCGDEEVYDEPSYHLLVPALKRKKGMRCVRLFASLDVVYFSFYIFVLDGSFSRGGDSEQQAEDDYIDGEDNDLDRPDGYYEGAAPRGVGAVVVVGLHGWDLVKC